MRLVALEPRWWAEPGRHGQGILFQCPHCVAAQQPGRAVVTLCVAFKNPLDGGLPWELNASPRRLWRVLFPSEDFEGFLSRKDYLAPPGHLWTRTGTTFEALTLSPSVDFSRGGHWHGFLKAGATD